MQFANIRFHAFYIVLHLAARLTYNMYFYSLIEIILELCKIDNLASGNISLDTYDEIRYFVMLFYS